MLGPEPSSAEGDQGAFEQGVPAAGRRLRPAPARNRGARERRGHLRRVRVAPQVARVPARPLYAHFLVAGRVRCARARARDRRSDRRPHRRRHGRRLRPLLLRSGRPAWRRQVITLYLVIEVASTPRLIGFRSCSSPARSRPGLRTRAPTRPSSSSHWSDLYLTNIVDLPMTSAGSGGSRRTLRRLRADARPDSGRLQRPPRGGLAVRREGDSDRLADRASVSRSSSRPREWVHDLSRRISPGASCAR